MGGKERKNRGRKERRRREEGKERMHMSYYIGVHEGAMPTDASV